MLGTSIAGTSRVRAGIHLRQKPAWGIALMTTTATMGVLALAGAGAARARCLATRMVG
jgi:hypothetical protein